MENLKISYNNLLVYKQGYTVEEIYNIITEKKLNGLRIFAELKNDRLDDISFFPAPSLEAPLSKAEDVASF